MSGNNQLVTSAIASNPLAQNSGNQINQIALNNLAAGQSQT